MELFAHHSFPDLWLDHVNMALSRSRNPPVVVAMGHPCSDIDTMRLRGVLSNFVDNGGGEMGRRAASGLQEHPWETASNYPFFFVLARTGSYEHALHDEKKKQRENSIS